MTSFSLVLCGILGLLIVLYGILIFYYHLGWKSNKRIGINTISNKIRQKVAIIIAARNEEKNIFNCLQSIVHQKVYNIDFEIIVVDDQSEDKTNVIVKDYFSKRDEFQLLNTLDIKRSGKKSALQHGIQNTKADIILISDADCILPEYWLQSTVDLFNDRVEVEFVAGPVQMINDNNLFEAFQALDFIGMLKTTAGGINHGFTYLANGANMAFRRSTFWEIGGFDLQSEYASGDDIFLVQSIAKRYPGSVFFHKDHRAIVKTQTIKNIKDFYRQRLRWGTKNANYSSMALLTVTGFVYVLSASLLTLLIVSVFWSELSFFCVFFFFFTKSVIDFFYLREACIWFGRKDLIAWIFPVQFMHVMYIAIIGTISLFSKEYRWKGRITS